MLTLFRWSVSYQYSKSFWVIRQWLVYDEGQVSYLGVSGVYSKQRIELSANYCSSCVVSIDGFKREWRNLDSRVVPLACIFFCVTTIIDGGPWFIDVLWICHLVGSWQPQVVALTSRNSIPLKFSVYTNLQKFWNWKSQHEDLCRMFNGLVSLYSLFFMLSYCLMKILIVILNKLWTASWMKSFLLVLRSSPRFREPFQCLRFSF